MQIGELRLVGGLTVVRQEKLTMRERVASAFFEAFSVDTGENSDGDFENKLAAAFRLVDQYNTSRGWRPPDKVRDASLSLFGAE